MSKRKPNNPRARLARSLSAILRSNSVAIIHIDPSGKQGLIHWRQCKSIPPGQRVADALCDLPHRWTIYLSAFCTDQQGRTYSKSCEVEPQGLYLAEHLTDLLEHYSLELRATCNPIHLIGSGWIAIPDTVELDEAQAVRLFEAVGAWQQEQPCPATTPKPAAAGAA